MQRKYAKRLNNIPHRAQQSSWKKYPYYLITDPIVLSVVKCKYTRYRYVYIYEVFVGPQEKYLTSFFYEIIRVIH